MKKITRIIIAVLIAITMSLPVAAFEVCEKGYLDIFVTPTSEGGWGLPTWIVGQMTETRAYTHVEIYDLIQASGLDASVKALDVNQIRLIMEWMVGKEFNGVTLGIPQSERITYVPGE
jgi:hypothetical protein